MKGCALGASLRLMICAHSLTFGMQLVGGILPIMHMRTVCVKKEQKNAKQLDVSGRIAYRQNFLEEGKLVVGVVCVMCVVLAAMPSCKNTVGGCWFFQILQYILPSVEFFYDSSTSFE